MLKFAINNLLFLPINKISLFGCGGGIPKYLEYCVEKQLNFEARVGINYIGIGDIAISDKPDDIIKTMALGSCVGVMLYDPRLKIAALGHIALPDSNVRSRGGVDKPGRYADTGIPLLAKAIKKMGSKGGRSLIVKIAGGAQINDPNNTFNIGKRNVLAVKKILWKCSLILKAEDTGGTIGRTMNVSVDTGEVTLSSPGRSKWRL